MKLFGESPLEYYNRWLAEPVIVEGVESVESILDALNRHPLAQDESAQDYIMPTFRYREEPGHYGILGENQDTWYCFVAEGTERLPDPPVYFETCLDLKRDFGFADDEIIDGDHLLVCPSFQASLWHMLGSQICLRLASAGQYTRGVHGVSFGASENVELDDSFINPLGRRFPAGYTCFVAPGVFCIPDWGAAFLDAESGRRFLEKFQPVVSQR